MSDLADRATRKEQHRAAVTAGILDHARRVRWSADRLSAERGRGLQSLLALAKERSPFHADRLAGTDPAHFGEEDLPSVPVMTKSHLMDDFSEVVTDRRLSFDVVDRHLVDMDRGGDEYLLDRYRLVASSGSSGLRGVHVYGWDEWTTLGLMASRSRLSMIDGGPRPPGSATVNLLGSGMNTLSSAMSSFLADPADPSLRLPMGTAVGGLVAALESAQPVLLQAYPTALDLLIREARRDRLHIGPRYVESGGELLAERTRQDVREVWGVEIDDCWGLSEGIYAFSCPVAGGMHLPDDLVIVEPVDLDGQPVPPGEPASKVYITNLYNHTQPLIRFEVPDGLTLFEGPCACGSHHRRIDSLTGRNDQVFEYGNGVRVYPMVLGIALEYERGLIEYQVHQTPHGIEIRAVTEDSVRVESLRTRAEVVLRVAGLAHPEVTIQLVDHIDRLPSGKLRQFVAELS